MIQRLALLCFALLLSGCDIAALLADPRVAQREADAKAIGGACRYAMRSLEDCYVLNPKASKSAIFNGWKDMDQYMRENKVEGVASVIPQTPPPAAPAASAPPVEEVMEDTKPEAAKH